MKNILLTLLIYISSSFCFSQTLDTIKTYYLDGKIKTELIRKNPGTEFAQYYYIEYWENGNFKVKGDLDENGNKIMTWRIWHENGNLRRSRYWKNGSPHGKELYWNNEGVLIYELTWKNGKRHGTFKAWDDSGERLIAHRVYKRSKLIESVTIDKEEGLLIVKN